MPSVVFFQFGHRWRSGKLKILQNKTLQQLQLELAARQAEGGEVHPREGEGFFGTNKNHLVWSQPAGQSLAFGYAS